MIMLLGAGELVYGPARGTIRNIILMKEPERCYCHFRGVETNWDFALRKGSREANEH